MDAGDVRAQIVLLGASNVTKGISIIINTAEQLFGTPLDVRCAIGHGRSYGMRSTVLVRSLPSILESNLWAELDSTDPAIPTYALIGDVGNDVMYGPPPQTITHWVEQCVDRLAARTERIVVTSLPLERIAAIGSLHYLIARTVFFPTKRLSLSDALASARQVVQGLQLLTDRRGIPFVELPAAWYGIDPIHIKRSFMVDAWSAILSRWIDDPDAPNRARPSLRRWLQVRTKSPDHWWLMNMQRGRRQPAVVLDSGTRVSLY